MNINCELEIETESTQKTLSCFHPDFMWKNKLIFWGHLLQSSPIGTFVGGICMYGRFLYLFTRWFQRFASPVWLPAHNLEAPHKEAIITSNHALHLHLVSSSYHIFDLMMRIHYFSHQLLILRAIPACLTLSNLIFENEVKAGWQTAALILWWDLVVFFLILCTLCIRRWQGGLYYYCCGHYDQHLSVP